MDTTEQEQYVQQPQRHQPEGEVLAADCQEAQQFPQAQAQAQASRGGHDCYSTLAPPPSFIMGDDGTMYPVVYDRAADLARIDPGPRKGVL